MNAPLRKTLQVVTALIVLTTTVLAQAKLGWKAANAEKLESVIPARALVGNERIETEKQTATGIVDERGNVIAAVVLITAGYAADGKYSHFLLVQSPLVLDGQRLAAGSYVVGWSHQENGLAVHIFDAASGGEQLTVAARPIVGRHMVVAFHIWPPAEHTYIQIGRYMVPYTLES